MQQGRKREMTTKQISVQRLTVVSTKRFDEVVTAVKSGVGHTDLGDFQKKMGAAKNYADLEGIVHQVTGASDLMEFLHLDLGAVLRKDRGDRAPRSVRLLIGNPLTMKRMLEHVPDAGSYAPVTILIDERADGVHLTYDKMGSLLASHGNAEAMKVAQELDSKIEALLTKAAN
jgi:uncharacterized protein (DUF302 family)